MIKKKFIFGIAVASMISVGVLSACGNEAAEAVKEEKNENAEEVADTIETDENADEAENADVTDETSFGLQDYAGFYCVTAIEEIEDYEISYTSGYLFNGDGTGVSYVQDVVEFTWNETEIRFGDSTETFVMEPGKLTVGDVTYDKIEGNFIAPDSYKVDTDNIANGIYYAGIDNSGISDVDGKTTISAEIFTEDSYDIVDIHKMAEGDVIYINGQLLPVTSIEETDWGIININGGIENMGSALTAVDESNCFVYAGMDMERSYTRQGVTSLTVSDDVKFIDNSDPSEAKEYTGSDAVSALKDMLEKYPLSCYDCKIMVEEGEIIEINRMYRP